MDTDTRETRKTAKAAYMREWRKRNPLMYAAELERNRLSKATTKHYHRNKDDPEFQRKKKSYDRASYLRNREKRLARAGGSNYGITPEEYTARVSRPCDICGVLEPRGKRGCGMHVDHDHTTGKLRGTLCHRCNRGIGMFGDDPERLEKAVAYVRQWKE